MDGGKSDMSFLPFCEFFFTFSVLIEMHLCYRPSHNELVLQREDTILTPHTMGKNFSRGHYNFFFFSRKQILTFHAN